MIWSENEYFSPKRCTKEFHPHQSLRTVSISLKGEMIDKLTLTYNRTRQAVITRGLIEIISGAAALDHIENFLLK